MKLIAPLMLFASLACMQSPNPSLLIEGDDNPLDCTETFWDDAQADASLMTSNSLNSVDEGYVEFMTGKRGFSDLEFLKCEQCGESCLSCVELEQHKESCKLLKDKIDGQIPAPLVGGAMSSQVAISVLDNFTTVQAASSGGDGSSDSDDDLLADLLDGVGSSDENSDLEQYSNILAAIEEADQPQRLAKRQRSGKHANGTCDICPKEFRLLEKHMISVHNKESEYFCNEQECQKDGLPNYCPSRSALHSHNIYKHGATSNFQCGVCNKYFHARSTLETHIARCLLAGLRNQQALAD